MIPILLYYILSHKLVSINFFLIRLCKIFKNLKLLCKIKSIDTPAQNFSVKEKIIYLVNSKVNRLTNGLANYAFSLHFFFLDVCSNVVHDILLEDAHGIELPRSVSCTFCFMKGCEW